MPFHGAQHFTGRQGRRSESDVVSVRGGPHGAEGAGACHTETQEFCLTVSLGEHKGGRGHFQSMESRNGFLEAMALELGFGGRVEWARRAFPTEGATGAKARHQESPGLSFLGSLCLGDNDM